LKHLTFFACIKLAGILFQLSTTLWEKNCPLISSLDACGLWLRGSAALRVGLPDSVTDVNQLGNNLDVAVKIHCTHGLNLFFFIAQFTVVNEPI
jgi:hypothetical protein